MRTLRWIPWLLLAGSALAQEGQIKIGWGEPGALEQFVPDACEPGREPAELVIVFAMPAGLSKVQSMEATLDFCTLPFDLPAFWGGEGSEQCTPAPISVSADFTDVPDRDEDYWNGLGEASFTYETGFDGNPVRARAVITVTIDPQLAPPAVAGEVYCGAKFIVDSAAATCPGCEVPACFVVNGITLTGPEGSVRFYGPYYANFSAWFGMNDGCPFIVSTQPTSFGGLRALFD